MLAHKMGNIDAIRVLCDHGANPKIKPFSSSLSPYDLAIQEKNREILKIYIQTN